MTMKEVYAICKLVFPDKMMRFNGCSIRIDWYYEEIRKCIWIEQHYDRIYIESVGSVLPSWFKDKIDYGYDKLGKVFKGFKDSD